MGIADRMIAAVAPPNCRPTQRCSLLRAEAMRTGATMIRHGFDLVLTAMLIVGICTLLSVSTILVRSTGASGRGSQVTADPTLADLRGTLR
jgi:hypothetical protein